MAKKQKYKTGDLILIPLESGIGNMVGRILSIDGGALLLEIYRMHPIMEAANFDFNVASNDKPILNMWCYDKAVKNGTWPVIANRQIENLNDIYFWTEDAGGGGIRYRKIMEQFWGRQRISIFLRRKHYIIPLMG
ncbi:Imm26 family immunity protein [Cohnella fermenti]|uniref:Uncharacterized protein n=1 Tax=Cohnella fermenti TaxID=2565925 RepID=A0A4S4C1Z6_9BACL|nr:Imm26 family immunity protein [Cohnella fermenti]THF81693.1 hypothetical protein E6C55_08165 [Cohnella fermenti]